MTLVEILTIMQKQGYDLFLTDEGWKLNAEDVADAQGEYLNDEGFITQGTWQPNGSWSYVLTDKGKKIKPEDVMFK